MSTSEKAALRLDWCSYEAAKYAVEKWHYSRSMPAGKMTRIGVWEGDLFVGCVIFARGSNKFLGLPFGLSQMECVELVRVALARHQSPSSRVVAIACRMLKRQSPGLRLLLSFADTGQGHIGTLYQAAGWLYAGLGTVDPRSRPYLTPDGRVQHWRTVNGILAKCGHPHTLEAAIRLGFQSLAHIPKHRYLLPLDAEMRTRLTPLAKPYPKKPTTGRPRLESEAPGTPVGHEGAAMRPGGSVMEAGEG